MKKLYIFFIHKIPIYYFAQKIAEKGDKTGIVRINICNGCNKFYIGVALEIPKYKPNYLSQ